LLTAGFCSSGICGIDGVWTKLKYHSSPIHITPDNTCSQRMKNAHHAWSNFIAPPTAVLTMIMITTSRTMPAMMVRPSD
jgi:hypothetical protein